MAELKQACLCSFGLWKTFCMYCPLLSCNIYHKPRFFYYLAVSSEGLGLHHIAIMTLCGG